jgi:hypothetical protein
MAHKPLNPAFQEAAIWASLIPLCNPSIRRDAIRQLLVMLKKAING